MFITCDKKFTMGHDFLPVDKNGAPLVYIIFSLNVFNLGTSKRTTHTCAKSKKEMVRPLKTLSHVTIYLFPWDMLCLSVDSDGSLH